MKKTLLTLIFFTFFAADLLAQSGRITGKVTEAGTGEVLIGVNVVIQGTTQGANTDLDGNYRILNVQPGTYTVEFRYIGFQSQIVEDVLVRADLNTEINMELREQVVEGEEVVVQAVRDVVIRDLTSSESRVVREDLARLPVQEVSDVVQLQTGVTTGPGGGIHIRGGRTSEVAYVVDGIRVSDNYDRGSGLRVENQSIEEIQVVSGTFNAEYGQATSGIINISSRSGSSTTYRGDLKIWGGEYGTPRNNLFLGTPNSLNDADPFHQYNLEGSFSGPIIRNKLTFFVSGRRFSNPGWLNGRNVYSPQGPIGPTQNDAGELVWQRGLSEVPANNPVNLYGQRVDENLPWYEIVERTTIDGEEFIRYRDTGQRDSSLVNLNPFSSTSFQGNIQYNYSRLLRFNLIGNYGRESSQGYNHNRRFVPGGISSGSRENSFLNFKSTITPTSNTFLTANIAYRSNAFESSLFDDPYDRRYLNFDNVEDAVRREGLGQQGRFDQLGTDNSFFNRRTQTITAKADISSQVTDVHFLKGGVEMQADILDFQSYSLVPLEAGGTLPQTLPEDKLTGPRALDLGIPRVNTPGHEKWTRKPLLLSAYLQDRIQFSDLTINVGVRFDYFQPNGRVPADDRPDLTSPFENRPDGFWKNVSPKSQLSPRFGIAYPISDNGVIHFSYGYFFQVPDYSRLYNGDKLILQSQSGVQGIFGNPDLKPERSTKYELGLQQEVFPGTALDLTIFYEDKRDYVSSGPVNPTANPSVRYGTWINRDFANIRGLTAALNQRVTRRISFGVDYTFSIAEDSNSDPGAEFFAAVSRGDDSGENLAKFLTPANWDRTHVLNSSLFYERDNWGFNIVQRFQTGLPYTPSTDLPRRVGISSSGNISSITNSVRMPDFFSIDLNFYTNVTYSGYRFRIFANVYNLLDNDNLSFVYNDSGSAELPLQTPDEFDDGFYNNPTFYGEPRRVQLGFQLTF